jgi:hypothetical protein
MTHTTNLPALIIAILIALSLIIFCISKLRKINNEIKAKPKVPRIKDRSKNKKELTEFEAFILVGGILMMLFIVLSTFVSILTVASFLFFSILLIGAFYSK